MRAERATRRARRAAPPGAASGAGTGVALLNLGCPKNLVDGEMMLGLLVEAGYRLCADPADAEVQIVNTCAFIRAAQEESIGEILAAARWREQSPARRLVVAGCLAQRHGEALLREIPQIDALVGPGRIGEIAAAVSDACKRIPRAVRLDGFGRAEPWEKRILSGAPHTAYVKIAEGCDHRCAYCLIPDLRGPLCSRPPDEIVEEVKRLGEAGAREAVLVAQDTTAYGRDLTPRSSLADLLRRLRDHDGPEWIRVLYTHPAHWDDELIAIFAGGGRLLPYVDLPVQHISDAVLAAMGRGRSGARIRRTITRLRERIPGLILRTTVMTGHPGEGRREFNELLQFLREFPFDRLGAFAYSPQSQTRSASQPGRPRLETARRRQAVVLELQRELALPLQRRRRGQVVRVLVEGVRPRDGMLFARSYGEAPEIDGIVRVRLPAPADAAAVELGEFMTVRIVGAGAYDLSAIPVTEAQPDRSPASGPAATCGRRRGKRGR
jgi:ribosomal protein S12 methylthiotransferase